MKVMKFGGTSVGSVNSILSVKQIVEAVEEPVIVVVSALGGITDKLINTSQMAANGDSAYEKEYREIVNRHIEMVYTVIPAGNERTVLLDKVNELLSELKDIFQGIYLIKDLSSKTSATIVSYGERLSSIIVASLIKGAVWYDSRNFIKTEKKHAKHILDSELTTCLVKEAFQELPEVALVPGFISTDKNSGEVTNLGRGGSDYTASVIAAALNADSLEIWTDVDGFMTADPRVISTAYTINELSYVEAMELCNFGAKVVYPPTIYPVCHKNIPILIKNTFNPQGEGTIIKQEVNSGSKAIKGISSINDTSLITVQGLGMVGVFNDDIAVCQHSFNVAVSLLTMGTKVAFVVGSNRAEGLPVFLRMDQNGVIFGRVVIQNSVQHLVLHFDESEGLVHAFFVFAGHNGNDITHKTDMAVDEQAVTGTGLRERLACLGIPGSILRDVFPGKNRLNARPLFGHRRIDGLDNRVGVGRAEQLDDEAVGRNEIVHVNWLACYQLHGIFFAVCFADGFHSAASCFCFFQARKFKIPRSWPS